MNEYDVVIVGAGPGGSSAAKMAAERGLMTIILEEHTVIGIPNHCWGMIFPQSKQEFVQEILGSMDKVVILKRYNGLRVYAPSGKVLQEVSIAGNDTYLIRRDYFDQELAKQAVNAGAELRLNTRVTGFIKQDGRVTGVTTSSASMPEVYGKIVIGADGIHAIGNGTPKWSGLTRPQEKFMGGVALTLTRVRDIENDVLEYHAGAFTKMGWIGLNPVDDVSCTTALLSMNEFERIKTGNYALSKKFKEAVPLRMTGFSHAVDMGVGLPGNVQDGLILIGSAANIMGIFQAIATAHSAVEVAIEAIRDGDVSAKRLSRYEDLCKPVKRERGFLDSFPFYEQPDEVIEKRLIEMIEKDEFSYGRPRII
ncbi:NAD(P)/FAD-dependent oxidoreductase [Chloroflexota bacterium]